MRMMLRPVQRFPINSGEWTPVRIHQDKNPTGVMLACPACGARLHLGPAPHPSGHQIEWEDEFKKFSITQPITCGITKNGKVCSNRFIVTHGIADDTIPE